MVNDQCYYKLIMVLKGCCWTMKDARILGLQRRIIQYGPETRLDCSELLCNKVLLKYQRDRHSFWRRHQKGDRECHPASVQFIQSLSRVWPFVTPWTAACQASLSITNSQSIPKLMSIESVMPSNHLIFCCPLLLLPSVFPNIKVFSDELAVHIRWPQYCNFSISPSNEHSVGCHFVYANAFYFFCLNS